MDYCNTNSFDKLWYCFSNSMSMEQLLKFALTSKVILSYEIDYLNSFHDRLMQGLWKRSPNGCFCKMDDRHEKLAYIILNEDYEAETEKSLEKFRKMSNSIVAQKVFDETPESESCILQQGEVVCEADQVLDEMSSAHQVFEEMSEPILSSNNDQVTVIGDHRLLNEIDEVQPSVNGIPEPYVDGNMPGPHKLFHTMPVPTFILEMAQAAKTMQENEDMEYAHQLFDTIPEPTKQANMSQIVCQAVVITNEDASVNNDHFTHDQQLSETPDALNASYLHDMVIIKTNRKHTLMLQGLISPSCAAFDQTPNEYGEFYNGNSYYLEYPYLQVTIKPSPSFVEIGSHDLYKDAMNIYYDDLMWNMLSEPIYFYRFVFDPGVLLKWVSNFENFPLSKLLEFKMELRGYLHCKEVYSWEKLEVILGVLIGLDSLVKTFQPSSSHNFVNFLLYSAIHNHAHTRTLNSCGNSSENADLMIVHYMDLRPGVLNTPTIYLFHGIELLSYNITCSVLSYGLCDYNMSTSRMSDQYRLFDPGIRVHDASVSIFTYILEDKDDFRGEEDTLWSIWRAKVVCFDSVWVIPYVPQGLQDVVRVNTLEQIGYGGVDVFQLGGSTGFLTEMARVKNCATSNFKPLREMTFCLFIFDLGGLKINGQMHVFNVKLQQAVHTSEWESIQLMTVWIFDPGGWKYSLSRVESLTSIFLQPTEILSFLLCLNLLEQSQYCDCAHDVTILVCIGSTVMKFREQASALLLCIGPMNTHARVILIFDPGGYDYRQEIIHGLKACHSYQYGGNGFNEKRHKDYQCYVFDPGGPLTRLVIDAMARESQPKKCYAMPLLHIVYYLSLILEDKDNFKRRVLIRTKIIMKGSIVISAFILVILLVLYKHYLAIVFSNQL